MREKLRGFLTSNFMLDAACDQLKDDTSFLERGIIDSAGVVELLTFLESEFKITVEDEEVVHENLDSIDRLCRFLEKKGATV